jgi:hypothetical protein
VPKDKSANFDGGNGHRIFVDLGRTGLPANASTREGEFTVLDANGTDGTAAFQLPNPDPDGDGTTAYSVYVRALGKPDGKATMQSCYEDATGTWCAVDFLGGVEPITIERTKGAVGKFENVSKDLLFVDYCTAWDAGADSAGHRGRRVYQRGSDRAFSTLSYFWSYDNKVEAGASGSTRCRPIPLVPFRHPERREGHASERPRCAQVTSDHRLTGTSRSAQWLPPEAAPGVGAGYLVTTSMTGRSLAGRLGPPEEPIGLGVWVSDTSPAWCSARAETRSRCRRLLT